MGKREEGSLDSEESLVEAARRAAEGDLRAFEKLVARHQARVVGNCRYITRSDTDAQDLAQEVFVKVFFGLRGFEGRSSFATWVNRIKVNHCLNHLKKKEQQLNVSLEEPGLELNEKMTVEPEAHERMDRRGEQERIREVLDSMGDSLRIPLILRDLDGLSYNEISESLGIGLSAVKMRIKRAREEFRSKYPAGESASQGAGAS